MTFSLALAVLTPDEWEAELNFERKITRGELREKGAEGVFSRELQLVERRLGAKSLPSRAELLFRHLPIRKHKDILKQEAAYYAGLKLKEADDRRHGIIDGVGWPKIDVVSSGAVASVLHEAAFTALRSIAFKFGLPLDAEHFQIPSKTKKQ